MSVLTEDVEKACKTHKQAQMKKTRIMWEAREKLAPGIHAQEKATEAARNPMLRKMIAVAPTNVPEAFPRTAYAEFRKMHVYVEVSQSIRMPKPSILKKKI
jgi:hypothetical protein